LRCVPFICSFFRRDLSAFPKSPFRLAEKPVWDCEKGCMKRRRNHSLYFKMKARIIHAICSVMAIDFGSTMTMFVRVSHFMRAIPQAPCSEYAGHPIRAAQTTAHECCAATRDDLIPYHFECFLHYVVAAVDYLEILAHTP